MTNIEFLFIARKEAHLRSFLLIFIFGSGIFDTIFCLNERQSFLNTQISQLGFLGLQIKAPNSIIA